MPDLTMPTLGADMTQGKLVEWLVKPGDRVHRGDIVAVIDTDKAEIEIESFQDGVVEELVVEPGARVPVGTTIARLGAEAEKPAAAPPAAGNGRGAGPVAPPAPLAAAPPPAPSPAEAPPPAPSPAEAAPPPPATPPAPAPPSAPEAARPAPAPPPGHRPRITPLARRVAAERGIDPAALAGTGPGGAVTRADVEAAAAPAPAPPAADRQAAMRQAIAALMARSKREVPHYYLQTTIDLSRALAHLDDLNAQRPAPRRLLPAALLLRAAALAARDAPALNGHWVDGALRSSERVHLGVAIALRGGGVVAPAVHDADRLGLDELMEALRDLRARVRGGRLRASEMTDATITVTQLGDRGADAVHGVIYVPQVALAGFGRVVRRPWAEGDLLGVRPTVVATLAADHRASDGHAGSRFLAAIDDLLRRPEEL